MKLLYLRRWKLRVLLDLSFLFRATFDSFLFIISQEKNPATNTHLLFPFTPIHFLFPPNLTFLLFFPLSNFSNMITIAQLSLLSLPRKANNFFPHLSLIYSFRVITRLCTSHPAKHFNTCNRKACFKQQRSKKAW